MAGGQMWTRAGEQIAGDSKPSTNRLVLFTPAMDFFRAPGALDAVRVPIQAWSGTADTLTPPSQAELLKHAAGAEIDLRVIEGAGHFSFMNLPPPHISDPMPDREAFLHRLAQDAGQFLLGE
jgi:predicted dienelactone hydrolase